MKRPFRQLGLAGFGAPQAAPSTLPLPSDEQIAEEEKKQKEEKPWIIELLEIPDEFLGGQMFKGLLTGDVSQGLLNNPLFQLTDAIGLTDVTEDVTFADVREGEMFRAMGIGGRGSEVRDGFANLVINTAGEILSSPVELFFAPFAKVGTAGAKLATGARLAKFTASEATETLPGLLRNVEQARRAFMVFKVPFKDAGVVFQPYKNLDVQVAKGLEAMAVWFNQNPILSAFRKGVSPTALGGIDNIPNGPRAVESQANVTGAVTRGMGDSRLAMLPFVETYNALVAKNRDMVDPKILQIVTYAAEVGAGGIDDAVEMERVLRGGASYAKAQALLKRLLEDGDPARGIGRQEMRELITRAQSGDPDAAAEFFAKYPSASLEIGSDLNLKPLEETLRIAGLRPRPGIDFRADVRRFGFEPGQDPASQIVDAVTGTARIDDPALREGAQVIPGFDETITLTGAPPTQGMLARSEIARRVPDPTTAATTGSADRAVSIFHEVRSGRAGRVIEELNRFEAFARGGRGTLRDAVKRLKSDVLTEDYAARLMGGSIDEAATAENVAKLARLVMETDESEIVRRISDLADAGNKLMEELGKKDAVEFMMNTISGPYIPRIENRELAEKINAALLNATKEQMGGDALKQVLGFLKERDFFQLTAMEVNHLMAEIGSTVTARSPLKKLLGGKDQLETGQRTWSWLVEKSGVMDILKLSDDPDAGLLHEFFLTNPLAAWERRIIDGQRARDILYIHRELVKPEAGVAMDRARLADPDFWEKSQKYSSPQNKYGRILTARIVNDAGGSDSTSAERVMRMAINQERASQRLIAKDTVVENIAAHVERGEYTAATIKKLLDDSLVGFSASARVKSIDELADLETDPHSIRILKQAMRGIFEEQQKVRALRARGTLKADDFIPHKRAANDPNAVTLYLDVDKVDEMLKKSDPDRYITRGGGGAEIGGRREGFEDFLREGKQVEQPFAVFDKAGGLSIDDGRHRFAVLRDMGYKSVPVSVTFNGKTKREIQQLRGLLRREAGGSKEIVRKPGGTTPTMQRIAALEERAEGIREGIREASRRLGGLRDKEIKAAGRELRKSAQEKLEKASRGKFTPDQMAHYVDMMRRWEKTGSLALEEVRASGLMATLQKQVPNLEVVWMDGQVHKEIYDKGGVLDRLFSPDKWAKYFRGFDEFSSWWKMTTLWFPQTQVRNMVTNYAMLAMSGITPQALVRGAQGSRQLSKAIQKALKEGDSSLLDATTIKRVVDGVEEEIPARELYQELFRGGALGGGYVRDETLMSVGELTRHLSDNDRRSIASRLLDGVIPRLGPFKNVAGDGRTNPVFKTSAQVSDYMDNHARLVGTIARWQSGESLGDAVQKVMAASYNPSKSYTSIERGLYGRMIPFYRWLRFAVENQVSAYFKRPASVTYWGKLWKAARDASGIPAEAWNQVVPDYINEMFGVPLRRDSKGNPEFFLFGSYVPIGEISGIAESLGQIGETDGGSVIDWLGSRSNPAIKTILENVGNHSFFTGREIERFEGETTEMFGITMTKKAANIIRNVRAINELDRLNVLGVDDFQRLRIGVNANKRGSQQTGSRADTENPLLRAATGAFGFLPRLQQVRVEDEIGFSAGALERERSKIKGQIRKRLDDDRPAAKKDIEKLQEDLAAVVARLRALEVMKEKRGLK